MNCKIGLVASLTTPPSVCGTELAALPHAVEWLEVRADLVGDPDPDWLRSHFRGKLIYALRSRAEGGRFDSVNGARQAKLQAAAEHYDLVDLEAAQDLLPAVTNAIPASQRLISWQGVGPVPGRFEALASTPARLYRLAPRTFEIGEDVEALAFLKSLNRSDTIIYTMGKTGFWSRVLAPRLGSPMAFGNVRKTPDHNDEPTIFQLMEDYGFPNAHYFEEVYGIVGDPVLHSLSPRLHNAAYRALGYAAIYVPLQVDCFADFWTNGTLAAMEQAMLRLGLPLQGLTIASPHKEAALKASGASSVMARIAGSSNLFRRHNGVWMADTTDPEGVLDTLAVRGVHLSGKRAAIVGCGGSGRAMAAALDYAGADVTLVNRSESRGRMAVELLHLLYRPLEGFTPDGYDIVINATPVGRDGEQSPFPVEGLHPRAVVVDLVYGMEATPLVRRCRELGITVIAGFEVLLTQVRRQFLLMTNREMPDVGPVSDLKTLAAGPRPKPTKEEDDGLAVHTGTGSAAC